MSVEKFKEQIQPAFTYTGKYLMLGGAVYDKKPVTGISVNIPLSTINRHGLIAGATGTGKTKTIQRFAEALSEQGVNVLLMDIKGDISIAPIITAVEFVSNPMDASKELQIRSQTLYPFTSIFFVM